MKGGESMCCHTERHHGMHRRGRHHQCQCGCHAPGSYRPQFITKKQKIANLEAHLKVLQDEVKAVKEMIADIKK